MMILEGLSAGLPAPLEFIFPGQKRGKPLSGMAMSMVMKRMGVSSSLQTRLEVT
jgi:hypothetical protein